MCDCPLCRGLSPVGLRASLPGLPTLIPTIQALSDAGIGHDAAVSPKFWDSVVAV